VAYTYRVEQYGSKYVLTWPDQHVTAAVDRVRQHTDGRVTCQLKITVNTPRGALQLYHGQHNLAAAKSRTELARTLAGRYELDVSWDQVIEDLCREVLEREQAGEKAERLEFVEPQEPDFIAWPVILDRLPVIWYGPGGGGKTTAAMYFALLVQNGLTFLDRPVAQANVLYCDWEVDRDEAARRMSALARHLEAATGRKIGLPFYRRCVLPLVDEAADIAEDLTRTGSRLLIIDSAGPACGGDVQGADVAIQYFNALRKVCAITSAASVTITHVTKTERRSPDQRRLPIGSVYFENIPRMTWELRFEESAVHGEVTVGFFCRKTNSIKPAPFGLTFTFGEGETRVHVSQVRDIPTEEGTIQEMILDELARGPCTIEELVQAVNTTPGTVRNALSRLKHKGSVTNLGRGKWALVVHRDDEKVVRFPRRDRNEPEGDNGLPF